MSASRPEPDLPPQSGLTSRQAQVAKELELPGEALRFSYHVFENYGNMSSPSVLFVLREILDSGRPQPGQKGMLLTFGAGFSAFAALTECAPLEPE